MVEPSSKQEALRLWEVEQAELQARIRQQQREMVEDSKWLEQEERLLAPTESSNLRDDTDKDPDCTEFTVPPEKPRRKNPPIQGTVKLLNKDLSELINKLRLTQQNVVTSLSDECKRLMLAAAHTLAVDSKNLLDAVDQARLKAGEARTLPD
eukprot:gi/632988698/ref/XP_007883253.1/ PREDICTED: protein-tyrosine kinase 2-beta-like [Callorhinchus milii]